jgi:bifunctional non-homologous end joining protein LigD
VSATTYELGGHTVEVSKPDKVLFDDAGITKADLADHYERVATLMLPHLEGRPLVTLRCPDGTDGGCFMAKRARDHDPDWIGRATLDKREGGTIEHLVIDEPAALIYLAGQACIELHTWLSRVDRPEHPDQIIFDLDPSTDEIEPVIAGGRALRDLLGELGLPAFVKSSGSRGLHVHVPIRRDLDFSEAKDLSRRVARIVVERDPETFTLEHRKAERGDRVFVDILRNDYAQHAVAPYSVRARATAPVAVPLDWDEATASDFDPQRITVSNVARRLAQKDDPWAGFGDDPPSLRPHVEALKR